MATKLRHQQSLTFRAGPAAFREIRESGMPMHRIGTIAGASGGAKWLVLSQLDRVIARKVLPNLSEPVHLIATSIGAWRFACYAQQDPIAAIERFEEAYLTQSYSAKPNRQEITQQSARILDLLLGQHGVDDILSHPVLRTNILTVRSGRIFGVENRLVLSAALAAAASLNAVSRKTLGCFFDRALFYDCRNSPPFYDLEGFPIHHIALEQRNVRDAILATGSIPLVLSGVRDIAAAPRGVYRDGGVIDYHLDFPHSSTDKLALYLHFYGFLKPGWFDKRLPWRVSNPHSTDRTLLVSPSDEFVSRLPHGKIPDRHDFIKFPPDERERAWRGVVDACSEIADELEDVLENDRLAERIQRI